MIIKKPTLFVFLLLNSSVCSSTPSDQLKLPKQQQFQSEFRQNHDLSIFLESWPLIQISDQKINNVQLSAISAFRVWNNDPIQSLALQVIGQWDVLSLMVEPVIVNEPYGPDLLGVDYTRSGISGRITNAFARYENDMISVQLGRSPLLWGQSLGQSIIQSTVTPAYDHMDLRMNFGRFQLELLTGQLGSELLYGERVKRNISGHKLTWVSKKKKWLLGFGEYIIYTGKNRGMEWHYLNPFVPYFFTSLDGDEEENYQSDNDNGILFATMRYVYKPNLSIFGELIIDDFQVDNTNTQDGLGFKIGADGAFNISGKPITWILEWTSINSWTYIHHGHFTSWQNRGHALGFPYGPDLRSLYVQADIWITNVLLFDIKLDWLEKGTNTLSTEMENSENRNDPFPKLPVTIHKLSAISLSWYWKHGIIEAGWSNYQFPNKISFSDPHAKTDGSLFFKAQLFYHFKFDYQ